jgi:hypothetical protein
VSHTAAGCKCSWDGIASAHGELVHVEYTTPLQVEADSTVPFRQTVATIELEVELEFAHRYFQEIDR